MDDVRESGEEIVSDPESLEEIPIVDGEETVEPVQKAELSMETGAVSGGEVRQDGQILLEPSQIDDIVTGILSSEQVSGFVDVIQGAVYTAVRDVASEAVADVPPVEPVIPLEVVSVADVLERMQPVDSTGSAVLLAEPGEILVPGSEELTVIEVVQAILSYFQEDDNDLITDIRDHTAVLRQTVTALQADLVHPLLTTSFNDYSVTEGLLLLLVLWLAVVKPCVDMIKGGFRWLNS